jgi:histidinol-phosphate phosphatase family protein
MPELVGSSSTPAVAALLCDKDGTLVVDVPYNGRPDEVRPLPGVSAALARARSAGLRTAVVTNQSGVARGLLTQAELAAVLSRCDELLGPFDAVLACTHGETAGCPCRKPAPGMVLAAAAVLDVAVGACVVIGDTAADVEAAGRAGAIGILVPNARTLPHEVTAAAVVARDFAHAVELALDGSVTGAVGPEGRPPSTSCEGVSSASEKRRSGRV